MAMIESRGLCGSVEKPSRGCTAGLAGWTNSAAWLHAVMRALQGTLLSSRSSSWKRARVLHERAIAGLVVAIAVVQGRVYTDASVTCHIHWWWCILIRRCKDDDSSDGASRPVTQR